MKNIMTYTSVNRRKNNQDCCLGFEISAEIGGKRENITILLLSDGMGGHEHGEVAGRVVVDTMAQLLSKRIYNLSIKPHIGKKRNSDEPMDFPTIIYESMLQTNQKILMLIKNNNWQKAGATVVAVVITRNAYYWGSVGDSALYHWRHTRQTLEKISYDHSVTGILVEEGAIEPDVARFHSEKHRIVYHMGIENFPAREKITCVGTGSIKENDVLLLCSDGISGKPRLHDLETAFHDYGEIHNSANVVKTNTVPHSFDHLAEALLECGLQLKETDNQTLILFRPDLMEGRANQDNTTILGRIDEKQRLLEQIVSEKKRLEQRVNEISASLNLAETQKKRIGNDLEDKHGLINAMENEKRKRQEEINSLNESMEKSKTEIKSLNIELDQKESQIKNLIRKIKNNLEPKIKDAEVTQVEKDYLKQALEEKSKDVFKIEEDIRKIKKHVEIKNREIHSAEQEIKKNRRAIIQKDSELESATREINRLNGRLDALSTTDQNSKKELKKLREVLNKKSEAIRTREIEIDTLRDRLEMKEMEIKEALKAKTAVNQELETQKENSIKLKDELDERINRLIEQKNTLLIKNKQWKRSAIGLASVLFIGALTLPIVVSRFNVFPNNNPISHHTSTVGVKQESQTPGIDNRDSIPYFGTFSPLAPPVSYAPPYWLDFEPGVQSDDSVGEASRQPDPDRHPIKVSIESSQKNPGNKSTGPVKNKTTNRETDNGKKNGAVTTYTVKNGDSILRIAGRFKISQKELLKLNPGLKHPYTIYPGNPLNVPQVKKKMPQGPVNSNAVEK